MGPIVELSEDEISVLADYLNLKEEMYVFSVTMEDLAVYLKSEPGWVRLNKESAPLIF